MPENSFSANNPDLLQPLQPLESQVESDTFSPEPAQLSETNPSSENQDTPAAVAESGKDFFAEQLAQLNDYGKDMREVFDASVDIFNADRNEIVAQIHEQIKSQELILALLQEKQTNIDKSAEVSQRCKDDAAQLIERLNGLPEGQPSDNDFAQIGELRANIKSEISKLEIMAARLDFLVEAGLREIQEIRDIIIENKKAVALHTNPEVSATTPDNISSLDEYKNRKKSKGQFYSGNASSVKHAT